MLAACSSASHLRIDSEDPWESALARLFAGADQVESVFQPIVDLKRAVIVGYEALSRFPGPPKAPPNQWFEEAERLGCTEALEHLALASALKARAKLPPNTFLTINVGPDFLVSPGWRDLVESLPDLTRIVVEVTENRAITDYAKVNQVTDWIRRRGGSFAVDDAGSGYASLHHVLALRPDFVKLDRVFVTNCHRDPAKSAIIEMIGGFAGRVDAWVIAEGIETTGEMEELMRLSTPLAQGYLLGKPAAPWSTLSVEAALSMLDRAMNLAEQSLIGAAVEAIPVARTAEAAMAMLHREPQVSIVAILDVHFRPTALAERHPLAGPRVIETLTRVKRTSPPGDVLRRAATRPIETRFDPLVVIDENGKFEGIASLDRLIHTKFREAGQIPRLAS